MKKNKDLSYREIFKNVLPRSIASKAIYNMDTLDRDSFTLVDTRHDLLAGAFVWADSEEGYKY